MPQVEDDMAKLLILTQKKKEISLKQDCPLFFLQMEPPPLFCCHLPLMFLYLSLSLSEHNYKRHSDNMAEWRDGGII